METTNTRRGVTLFERNQMTIGAWAVYHLLLMIPIVNIIFIIMLLLSPRTNKSLKNLILFQIIVIVVFIFFGITLFGSFIAMFNQLGTG